ncbi:MAG: PaREP1 family protein [Promethearchaeia archaeon]
MTIKPKKKLENARKLYDLAIKELREVDKYPDKIRDASEKAWGATATATEALIEAKTGRKIKKGKNRSKHLGRLIDDDKKVPDHIGWRYYTRQDFLHGDCFYEGDCEPREQIKRRILETEDLINDIEDLINEDE